MWKVNSTGESWREMSISSILGRQKAVHHVTKTVLWPGKVEGCFTIYGKSHVLWRERTWDTKVSRHCPKSAWECATMCSQAPNLLTLNSLINSVTSLSATRKLASTIKMWAKSCDPKKELNYHALSSLRSHHFTNIARSLFFTSSNVLIYKLNKQMKGHLECVISRVDFLIQVRKCYCRGRKISSTLVKLTE